MIIIENHKARLAGSGTKHVVCEKCRTEFYYMMMRVGTGHGASPFFLRSAGAAADARQGAQGALAQKLHMESDPVPCPKCNWVQSHMVRDARYWRHHLMRTWGRWIAGVGVPFFLAMPVIDYFKGDGDLSRTLPVSLVGALILGTVGGVLIVGRHLLGRRIDLNRDYPRRPRELPGTPPALVPATSTDLQGNIVVVPARPYEPQPRDGWLGWRFLVDRFVPDCCVCLAPHDHEFVPPLEPPGNLRVPLCAPCHKRIIHRWWSCALLCVMGSFIAATPILAVKIDVAYANVAAWVGVAAMLSVASVAIIPWLRVRPYQVRGRDRNRFTGEIRFENLDYTRRLAKAMRWNLTALEEPRPVKFAFD